MHIYHEGKMTVWIFLRKSKIVFVFSIIFNIERDTGELYDCPSASEVNTERYGQN